MKVSNIVAVIVLGGAGIWVYENRAGLFPPSGAPEASKSDAVSRHNATVEEAGAEAAKAIPGGNVSENMTPDQVRAALGSPDEVETSTNDMGKPVEKWTYRKAGKVVTFVDGVAVSVGAN